METCSDPRSASEYTATEAISSSRSVRQMRIAISPRFATRTLVNGGIPCVFSPPVSFADQLTVARAAVVPLVVVLYVWDFPGHDYWATARFRRGDGNRLVRRAARSPKWTNVGARLAARSRRRQAPRAHGHDRARRPRRLRGLDGGGDRRAGAPHLRAPAGGARTRSRPRGARSRPPQDVDASGRRRARRARGCRRASTTRSPAGRSASRLR